MKKLYKSQTNKILSGVLGGVGEYYNIDPTILRLAYLLVAILTALFPAVLAYIIAAVIVPSRPLSEPAPSSTASAGETH